MNDQPQDTSLEEPQNSDISASVAEMILGLNETLEEQTITNANTAFNRGCLLGLIPAGVIVLLSYIFTGGSWLAAVLISILMFIGLMLTANLAAHTARESTLARVYQEQIEPQINEIAEKYDLTSAELWELSDEILPAGAPLRNCLEPQPRTEKGKINHGKS